MCGIWSIYGGTGVTGPGVAYSQVPRPCHYCWPGQAREYRANTPGLLNSSKLHANSPIAQRKHAGNGRPNIHITLFIGVIPIIQEDTTHFLHKYLNLTQKIVV